MPATKTACFFSHEPRAQLEKEQYSIQDIRILRDLGFELTVATTLAEVPWGSDLYFSWWASGSILPMVKARLSRKPIIVVAGGNDSTFYRDSLSGTAYGYLATAWYKRLATRISLRLATRVLAVSHFVVGDLTTLGARDPVVVPNSVDVNRFRPADGTGTLVTMLLNIHGDVVITKRLEQFIRAMPRVLERHPGQRFAIIGNQGSAYPRLRDLAAELGVLGSVDFPGSIPNADVPDWLHRSAVYVQISDTETFGVAIAEAMSAGTPVVVSRRGAIPELVGDCGIYVDHNDPGSVADGINRVLAMTPDERRALGARARERVVANYSYEARKAAVRKVIDELM